VSPKQTIPNLELHQASAARRSEAEKGGTGAPLPLKPALALQQVYVTGGELEGDGGRGREVEDSTGKRHTQWQILVWIVENNHDPL
jgi:hypothetical protein